MHQSVAAQEDSHCTHERHLNEIKAIKLNNEIAILLQMLLICRSQCLVRWGTDEALHSYMRHCRSACFSIITRSLFYCSCASFHVLMILCFSTFLFHCFVGSHPARQQLFCFRNRFPCEHFDSKYTVKKASEDAEPLCLARSMLPRQTMMHIIAIVSSILLCVAALYGGSHLGCASIV